jgi:hypothetical protein
MQVKLCVRCPYTLSDLTHHDDPDAALHEKRKHPMRSCLLVLIVLAAGLMCLLAVPASAQQAPLLDSEPGQTERHHPPQDQALHENFYSNWHMPDNPAVSCCNNADCYPTDIKYIDGKLYARRREDGKFIYVPPQKIERNRDNPDGRNHLCAPPPSPTSPSDAVYCFALGGAT